MLELKHFRLVKAIAECGSLRKASDVLFLSQSALSYQLKELETELGKKVFYRVNNKLVISETGELILNYSHKVLFELRELKNTIEETNGRFKGKIKIGLEAYTSYFWLPMLLKNFGEQYPDIDVVLNTESPTKPLHLLEEQKLDFAIVLFRFENRNFHFEKLFQDELVAVVSTKHPFAQKKYVEVRDFNNQNIITHSTTTERDRVLESEQELQKLTPKKYTVIKHTQTILEMVDQQLGVAVLSKWPIRHYISNKDITMVKLGPNGTYRNWYLAHLINKEIKLYEKKFIKILKEKISVEIV
ncbi:MAG: LysR family transcriptional regulator [Allomuricauda sp.]